MRKQIYQQEDDAKLNHDDKMMHIMTKQNEMKLSITKWSIIEQSIMKRNWAASCDKINWNDLTAITIVKMIVDETITEFYHERTTMNRMLSFLTYRKGKQNNKSRIRDANI